jgi:hypothetical protein
MVKRLPVTLDSGGGIRRAVSFPYGSGGTPLQTECLPPDAASTPRTAGRTTICGTALLVRFEPETIHKPRVTLLTHPHKRQLTPNKRLATGAAVPAAAPSRLTVRSEISAAHGRSTECVYSESGKNIKGTNRR